MATKTLNVRFQQKYDTAANWLNSEIVLLAGEMAIESDTGKFKFGDGEHVFKDLSYAGIDQAQLDAIEDVCYVVDSVGAMNGLVAKKGDIAVVKELIADGKYSNTAYMYSPNAEGSLVWQALDGNYNANNVYFANNITLAGNYTSVGNVNLSDGELAVAGMSIADAFTSIFTKELNTGLKTGDPSASITSFTKYYEIGTPASESVTVSLDGDGSYAYGYSVNPTEPSANAVVTEVKNDGSTGVTVDSTANSNKPYSVTFNGTTQTGANGTFTISAPAQTAKKELTASGKVYYTQGGVPVSNLKKAYPAQRITAGQTKASSASAKIRWYVPFYSGFIYGFDNKLSAVDVSKLTKQVDSTAYTATKPTSATATGSWMQYWLVAPKSYNWTMKNKSQKIGAWDANGLDLTVEQKDNITITYGTGTSAVEVEYNVFVISHDAAYDTTGISWN